MAPSTKDPQALPDIARLRRLTKSIAMLDAIIHPKWQSRYYSYNSKWAADEEMASMCDGCGDEWFLLFTPGGAALKGLAHESKLARDGILATRIQKEVPREFVSFLRQPAFSMDRATFCLWRRSTDSAWSVVSSAGLLDPLLDDGSADLLQILDGSPQTYHAWAESYCERDVPLIGVQAIYDHQPLSADLISALNSDITLTEITADASEIAYPEVGGR